MIDFIRFHRFKVLPIRYIIPNIITLLSLCLGLTAVRYGMMDRYETAVSFVLLACLLDGIDGRVARFLGGATRFGAELDSLADFVNFGVVPGLILYNWILVDLGNFGWVCVLIYTLAMALRLARFNVMFETPHHPWARNYFYGVPAPLGAIIVFLPLYVCFVKMNGMDGVDHFSRGAGSPPLALASGLYVLIVGMLVISKFPTFSLKHLSVRVKRQVVLPFLVLSTVFIFLLAVYTWPIMILVSILYLSLMPVSAYVYGQQRLKAQKEMRQLKEEEAQPSVSSHSHTHR